jgi:hypothetical protein
MANAAVGTTSTQRHQRVVVRGEIARRRRNSTPTSNLHIPKDREGEIRDRGRLVTSRENSGTLEQRQERVETSGRRRRRSG